jgi:hypothetical protein
MRAARCSWTAASSSGRNKYFRELDGHRTGVVLATRTVQYDSYALNKHDLDRLIASKREGKIDSAIVVAAKVNGGRSLPVYSGEIDAEELAAQLATTSPFPGKYGEFYTIPRGSRFRTTRRRTTCPSKIAPCDEGSQQ